MRNNLLVGVLGHRNSGKSRTWNVLFGSTVKTGTLMRHLFLTETEYVEVFLVSGSPEEREIYVGEIIGTNQPRIVLCSLQYIDEVQSSLDYFTENDYFLYIQWLNPGHHDSNNVSQSDYLGIMNRILALDSTISIRSGKNNPEERVQELTDYIYGWAASRGLLLTI